MAHTPEMKAAMLERLKAGKAKHAAARADAKAKGLPDPKPRKKRAKKAPLAVDPSQHAPANDTIRGIDQATKEGVADKPVDATPVESKPIDVPFLPEPSKRKKIVKNAEAKPELAGPKDLTTQGVPKQVAATRDITNTNTGTEVIEAQFPGQLKSITKLLKENKKLVTTNHPKPEVVNNITADQTVKNVKKHVVDAKSVSGEGKPFSFSAMRKILYQ